MYSSTILTSRVYFHHTPKHTLTPYGRETEDSGAYQAVWANVTFSRGVKSLREGAMDAYNTILIRCAYLEAVNRDTLVRYNDTYYRIDSLNKDYHRQEMQLTCTEVQN